MRHGLGVSDIEILVCTPHILYLKEGILNLQELLLVCALHLNKLAAHVLKQGVDILGLTLESLDKLVILLLQLILDVWVCVMVLR
jgi:hypothetical protein